MPNPSRAHYAVTDSPDEAQRWWAHGVHRTAAGIDYLVGLVPVAGDILDFAWKANTLNVRLLEEWYLEGERRPYQPSVVDISAAEA